MHSSDWKKRIKSAVESAGKLFSASKKVLLSAGLISLPSAQSGAAPRVPVAEHIQQNAEVRRYSTKYVLKSIGDLLLPVRVMQRHRSHSSHSSHSSHTSHYSGTSSPAPRSTTRESTSPTVTTRRRTPSETLSETFSNNALDTTKWKLGSLEAGLITLGEGVTVSERNARLEITPSSSASGRRFGGYVSVQTWDLTDAAASVEVIQTALGSANTVFALALDSENWYGFIVEGGVLYFQSKIAGIRAPARVPYNPRQHRYWRFRHDAKTNLLFWETSADGTTWVVGHAATPKLPISSFFVALVAGTHSPVAKPGVAVFDNFQLRPNQ